MSHKYDADPIINIDSFRNYWLRKLIKLRDNEDCLSEAECIRLKKKFHSMLQHLNQIEDRNKQSHSKTTDETQAKTIKFQSARFR